jgi:hypothetical protein
VAEDLLNDPETDPGFMEVRPVRMSQMMSGHGFDDWTASMLMGQAVEYEIANVVDSHFTVVATLRKARTFAGAKARRS